MNTCRCLGEFRWPFQTSIIFHLQNRLDAFTKAATTMLLGENSSALKEGRTMGVQVINTIFSHSAFISRLSLFSIIPPGFEWHWLIENWGGLPPQDSRQEHGVLLQPHLGKPRTYLWKGRLHRPASVPLLGR